MSKLSMAVFSLAFIATIDSNNVAHAYLDPGTGSMILQILLGGVAGALVIGKLYWVKLKSLFSSNKKDDDRHEDTDEQQQN
jgi:hypothetical protein